MSAGPDDEVNRARRWTQRRDTPRAQKAERTRALLIAVARELFAEQGYQAVGLRDVAERAEVSRGALTHHFADKESLFLAVFEEIEGELVGAGRPPEAAGADPWSAFRKGVQLYLDAAATRTDVQRITLVDGPAVLGWPRWRKLEEGYSLGAMTAALQAAMDDGRIRPRPVEPLAHLILGSVMEAALLIAHSENPGQRRTEVGLALDDLLTALA